MSKEVGILRLALLMGLGWIVLGACGEVTAPEGADRGELRVPVGKADNTMSCKGSCGDQAPGGCWCDDQCAKYGDCCTDKIAICDPKAEPSCVGACGKKSADGCWCDSQCAKYGDCCPDKKKVCDKPAGCTANSDCGVGEYCYLATGCLDGETKGECKKTPYWCSSWGKGVCGCDGKTYRNSCRAHKAGANIADAKNKCPADIQCGGIAGVVCPTGYKCWIKASYPDAAGRCVAEDFCTTVEDCKGLTPSVKCWGAWRCKENTCEYTCGATNPICYVGGCNSELCSDVKDAVSPCVAMPWHQCLAFSSCGNFSAEGSCTWKPTTEYVDCMAKFGKVVCDYDGDPATTYLIKDPDTCKVAKFTCAAGKKPFFDGCGCGCRD